MKVVVIRSGSKNVSELCVLLRQQNCDAYLLNFEEGLEGIARLSPQFVIMYLDNLGLHNDGIFTVISNWRATPLIVVVASNVKAETKIKALDAGAADLLTMPFGIGELMARMRAILRRFSVDNRQATLFESSDLQIQFALREVYIRGQQVLLTPTEFQILSHLVLNENRLVTKKQLEDVVLAENVMASKQSKKSIAHLVRVHINNLRNKIEKDPRNPIFIRTETKLGYRFRCRS